MTTVAIKAGWAIKSLSCEEEANKRLSSRVMAV